MGDWQVWTKGRHDFLKEREQQVHRQAIISQEKYKIEIEGMKEGTRIVIKQKFMNEWREAREAQLDYLRKTNVSMRNEQIDQK